MSAVVETISPEAFLSAAPRSVSGSSPWATRYAADIRRAWSEHAAQDPRTLQSHLGPSELGVPCDRQVAGKMAALPATNHVVDPWPSTRGRALHAFAEGVFGADNERHPLPGVPGQPAMTPRWLTERRVTPHDDHPGTADLYDSLEQSVVDHKFLGESSMAKIRKGWPRHYLVQLLLYGLGYWREGFPVRRVVLVAYPATAASLDGMYVLETGWSGPDGNPLPEVEALLTEVFADTRRRRAQADALIAGRSSLMDVPASPDGDTCFFCPFYRPQSARDAGPGCPGTAGTSRPD